MRDCLPFLCAIVAACAATVPVPTPATELSAGSIAARIEPTPGRTYELSILATDGSGKATQVARTTGVRLALDEEQGWNQSQPFVAFERTEHGIRLQCKPHGSHQISLDLVADPAGLKVNVRDSIGLRSRVRELAIDYQLVAAEQVEECWTPHLHPGNDSLAADQDFHLPLAFLRAGTAGLALAPTAESLSDRHRRMPQGLRVDPDLRRLRHGCFAITHRRDGARTLDELTDHGQEQRRIGRELQGETLEFGHLLIPFAAADAGTFDQTVAMLFSGMAAPWLRATAWPSSDSLLQLAARWRTAVAASMRTVQVGGTQITLLDDATGEPAPGEMTSCPLTWDRSSLGAAWTLLRQIPAAGNTGHDEAEKLVRTLLLAPRPGPMPPGRIVAAPAQQLFRSEPSPGGDYRLLDAGTTGCWLLRLAEELPVEHDRLLEQANELVPFLHANQGGAGGIPAYFTPEFLAPRRDRLFDGGAEGAGAAQFLVEHALATGQPASREAARAVLDLLAAVSHGSGWADSEIAVARTGLDPAQHPGQFVDGSLGWTFTALAAAAYLRTAEPADPDQTRILMLLDTALLRLARFQQIWTRPWRRDQLGGMRCTNLDDRWNEPRAAGAAEAFFAGYELLGRTCWLERGALALRASLADSADPVFGAPGAGLAAVERLRPRWGQAVVDVTGQVGVGIDAVWLPTVQVTADTIDLQLVSSADLQTARVVFHRLPPHANAYRIRVHGRPEFTATAGELAHGLSLPVQRLPRLRFLPPTELPSSQPWTPFLPVPDGWPESATAELELQDPSGQPTRVALKRSTEGLLLPAAAITFTGEPGQVVGLRVVAKLDAVEFAEPPIGWRAAVLAPTACLDPGDDDEHALLHAGASKVARFVDDREACRELPATSDATWQIPVPPTATRIRLVLVVAGALRAFAAGRLVYEDTEAEPTRRELSFDVVDRRLWTEGFLQLRLESLDQTLQVARIRYSAEGDAQLPSAAGLVVHTAARPSLRIAVVPLALDGAPLHASMAQLQTAFFGGPEYSMTPQPQPRPTAGSVSTLVQAMSGGATTLLGDVAPELSLPVTVDQLAGATDAGAILVPALLEHLEQPGRARPDVVVAIHGAGARLRLPMARAGGCRIVTLGDRETDGSFLAVGTAQAAILRALTSIVRPNGPLPDPDEAGLPPEEDRHLPASPSSAQLEPLGWADRLVVEDAEIALPVLQEDRAFVAMQVNHLPGRGELHVELRRPGPSDPGAVAGTYFTWQLGAAPVTLVSGGHALPSTALAVQIDDGLMPRQLLPARAIAFTEAVELGIRSRPTAATPQGEMPWSLALRRADRGRPILTIRRLDISHFDWRTAIWRSVRAGQDPAPMPRDIDLGPLGEVRIDDSSPLFVRPRSDGAVIGSIDLPTDGRPRRLFATVAAAAPAGDGSTEVSIGADTTALVRMQVAAQTPASAEIDLPPTARTLWLSFGATGHPLPVTLRSCWLVPRQPAFAVLTPPARAVVTEPWLDGVHHSDGLQLRCDSHDQADLELPVIVPEGRCTFRVLAGVPAATAAGKELRLGMELAARDGRQALQLLEPTTFHRRADRQPMWTILANVPPQNRTSLWLLRLHLRAPANTQLNIQTLEIVRS